jgi:hypothetical protein
MSDRVPCVPPPRLTRRRFAIGLVVRALALAALGVAGYAAGRSRARSGCPAPECAGCPRRRECGGPGPVYERPADGG